MERKRTKNFCEIFQESLLADPKAKAIIYENSTISYSQLNVRSNYYASLFIQNGLIQGDVVAVSIYNSIDLIPIILAVWKAGGVYLPVDPNYPKSRVNLILEKASPKLLIVDQKSQSGFKSSTSKTINIEKQNTKISKVTLPKIKETDHAYIIFTSGSTGRPKGILVNHKGLLNAALSYIDLHPGKFTSLLAGSISFDPNLLTIVFSLATRSTICLYNNFQGIDLKCYEEVVKIMQKNNVDFLLATPSFYSNLLSTKTPLCSLKNVDLCGENISSEIITTHSKISPNSYLSNVYGPTEYAMGSTAKKIYDPQKSKHYPITIGKCFHNNIAYVLNKELQETKVGEKGEIFVGGDGLAVGYLKDPELTNKKFISLCLSRTGPIKLYKTGDIGYRLSNDEIVFSGRLDFQIKINGHLVELEEIEHTIDKLPYIKNSIVIAVDSEINGRILVAFFIPKNEKSANRIKEDLKKSLPNYMIPRKFLKLEAFPLTENGKIDRNKLKSVYESVS